MLTVVDCIVVPDICSFPIRPLCSLACSPVTYCGLKKMECILVPTPSLSGLTTSLTWANGMLDSSGAVTSMLCLASFL